MRDSSLRVLKLLRSLSAGCLSSCRTRTRTLPYRECRLPSAPRRDQVSTGCSGTFFTFNKLGKSSCVVNRDFSGCVATGVHAPSQRMLHIPYIGNKCFINGSSKIIQTRLLAIVRILLPIGIQQKFTMRNRKQLVLGIYIILNKRFIVSFQRFFYNTPANQVIPARTFQCQLARTFFVLQMFQDFGFTHGKRQCRYIDTCTNLIYYVNGLCCFTLVI